LKRIACKIDLWGMAITNAANSDLTHLRERACSCEHFLRETTSSLWLRLR